jgi:hypothetical protein
MPNHIVKLSRNSFFKVLNDANRAYFPSPFEGVKDAWFITPKPLVKAHIYMYGRDEITFYIEDRAVYINNMSKTILDVKMMRRPGGKD